MRGETEKWNLESIFQKSSVTVTGRKLTLKTGIGVFVGGSGKASGNIRNELGLQQKSMTQYERGGTSRNCFHAALLRAVGIL